MGEIADYLIEQMEWRSPGSKRARPPVCRNCGVTCRWQKHRGKWRLFENNTPHRCAQAHCRNDFDIIKE